MIIIDSSGWIEYFSGGPLRTRYEGYLTVSGEIITPTVVLFEVYRKILRDVGKKEALTAASYLQQTRVAPLTESVACTAAEFSIEHSLPFADSIIYATAFEYGCGLVTSDKHFEGLPGVTYLRKD